MIRRASFADIEVILHVINMSNSESYRDIIPAEYFKEPILSTPDLVEFFHKMEFFVYEECEKAIGVSALENQDEGLSELKWVYVLPRHQRKGIGTELVKHLEKKAIELGVTEVVLYTYEKATWALNFYEKMGYEQIDRRKLPWGYEIMMKKELFNIG